jgi:hypothetical protein
MQNKILITVEVDKLCNMARVYDSNGYGMEGNYWDFHNGCHGMYDIKNFNSISEFVRVLKTKHKLKNKVVEVIYKNYAYDD